ncbi:Hypothetical predicted protein [Paramuricea clavata]|uniref:Uncharacterized protein n=1 Tax=Paramuricea clavata TaxID=317549 RepID=A0A7D9DCF7_PARCT|nr:Hypothetical predicted protein [Paramuricea clavata]
MTTANECSRPRTLSASKRLSKRSTQRVQNATEELQKYIEQFTDAEQTNPAATPISRCYGSSNVTLLSTKPKSFSSPKKHSRKAAISPEKQGKMVDNLVQWVNESYSKDLQRKIVPFGQRSNSSVDINGLSQTDGKAMSHPSWVEELVTAKHYPSWVDDIDESRAHDRDVRRNQRNRLSRSLSPSFFQEHPPLSPTPQSPLSTSLQDHPMEISDPHQKKSKAWDLESTDTEVLIGESIYGRQPVNMGGAFHSSLYRDKKIQQLFDHSVRKFAKDSERSLVKEMSFAQSHVDDGKTTGHPPQRFTKPTKMSNSKTSISKHTKKKAGPPMQTSKSFPHDGRTQNVAENNFQPSRSFNKNVYTSANRPSSLSLPKAHDIKSSSEIRKNSTDSSNTDRLMRKSPTGIQMAKQYTGSRNIENSTGKSRRSNKDDRISTQIPSPRVRPTPNMLYSSKDFHTPDIKTASRGSPNVPHSAKNVRTFNGDISPRRNASDELQRIIDQADSTEVLRQRKDHYLSGNVSKKDLTLQDRKQIFNNHARIHASTVSHTKRTEHNNNYSTKGYLHPTRTDPRNFSQRRLVPSGKYDRQTAWNENSSFGNHSESYERSSLRTKIPRNSDPTKLDLGTKIRDHKLRSRTKSAPNMKDGHMGSSSPERREGYRRSLKTRRRDVNYANKGNILAADYSNDGRISDADYANEDVLHDDTESVDTEALIIKPPMLLFDASPSLTTESAETTEDSEESGDTLIENLALRTSFLATDLQSSSGTSYLELSPKRDIGLDWEDEKPPNARLNTKPGIITSFLEDCMRNSQESRSDMKSDTGKFPSRSFIEEEPESVMSEDISSERPVETLKKMLFTVQRLTHSSEENSDQGVDDHSAFETQSESLTEEVLSDILSTASRNEGQDSLSRAYYHLARLKRLVSASKEVAAWK